MDKVLNVGVVGCGYWGPNLIRNFNSLSECTVKWVCDFDQERLDYIQRLYRGVKTTTDFNVVLKDPNIDAIVVATPVRYHYKLALASLKAGKHVFIEKPMASTSAQCWELNELAQVKKLTLLVGHTFVYTSAVRKIKEIVDSGEIGDIMYISSRRLNLGLFQQDINVAWDLAPHDISIILFMMESSPVSVNCQGKAHINSTIEDVTNMTLNFNNGGFATIHSSWLDPNKVRDMILVGSKKMIKYDDIEPNEKIRIYDKRVEVPPHYDTFAEFHYSYHYGDIYTPFTKQVEPLKVECQHFVDCVNGKESPISGGLEGLQIVQILEAANESIKKNGRAIPISGNKFMQMKNVA